MSYSNGTTHYNLPLTQGSDKRDWSDTNQAFEDIDAAVYQASSDATGALSAAQSAQTTANSAATDASSAVTTANTASASAASAAETAALARTEAQSAQSSAGSAVATAQSAATQASNADTVALAAQSSIGNLASLQTTAKNNLVAAINEVLQKGAGMKCKLSGVLTSATSDTVSVDVSSLGFTSENDYVVILDGGTRAYSTGQFFAAGLASKTASSFSIYVKNHSSGDQVYIGYQVLA